jgi:hypothetical protein
MTPCSKNFMHFTGRNAHNHHQYKADGAAGKPAHDLSNEVMLQKRSVDTVIIDGRILKRGGKLAGVRECTKGR